MNRLSKPLFALGVAGVLLHLLVSYEYYHLSWWTVILGSYPLVRALFPDLLVGVGNGFLAGPFLNDTFPYGLLSGLIAGEVLALALSEGNKPGGLRRTLKWWIGFSLGWVAFILVHLIHLR